MTTTQITVIPADATVEQLRQMASLMGLQFHHKAGIEKLRLLIEQNTQFTPANSRTPESHIAEAREPKVVKMNTEEQVREACALAINKPGFMVRFPRDEDGNPDGSFILRYRKGGDEGRGAWREESGNLSLPLTKIVRIANEVARGPLALKGFGKEHFEPGNTGTYTDSVLM